MTLSATVQGQIDDLNKIVELATPEELIDASQFQPIKREDLMAILGVTIKRDEDNKLVTFLAGLCTYTEDAQINISFNAPSSTGKSYIPMEVTKYFPKEDVILLAYCSPTAFFHDHLVVESEDGKTKSYTVDLARKILVFLDQPNNALLERLRPLLSHDQKRLQLKITDKNQKSGTRTKSIEVIGFPTVITCTAGLRIDEQEATRCILLSPETSQEKIREAVIQKIKKETDGANFKNELEANPDIKLLKLRIRAIKEAKIVDVLIPRESKVQERFLERHKVLKPRHQRDITKLLSLAKGFALLNLWHRDRKGDVLYANNDDVENAMSLWERMSKSQDLNLPPYLLKFYEDIISPAFEEKNKGIQEPEELLGLDRVEISRKHYEVYEKMLDMTTLRSQILPSLETAGLIYQEKHHSDKRKMLVYPTLLHTISPAQNNSVTRGGVTEELPLDEVTGWPFEEIPKSIN